MRYVSTRREIEGALPTVVELLRHRGEEDALRALSQAEIELLQTGHDSWNGNTELWTAYLRVPVAVFVLIEDRKEILGQVISNNLEIVVGKDSGCWVNIEIVPQRATARGDKVPDGKISDRTRAAVLDEMRARRTAWSGALDEIGFLSRIFDLTIMPSFDNRFENAEGDIWQHCVNNDDWEADWVFSDRRFRLYAADQETFSTVRRKPWS